MPPITEQRQCLFCSQNFTVKARLKTRYCRPDCWYQAAKKEKPADKTCLACGRAFVGRPRKANTHCSVPCLRVTEAARAIRQSCPACGKEVRSKPSKPQAHCSNACQEAGKAARREISACPTCGVAVISLPGSARKYCSVACRGIGRRNRGEATCQHCGQTFTKKQSKVGPYCNAACLKASKAPHRVTRDCLACGTTFIRKKSLDHLFCSLECYDSHRCDGRSEPANCRQCGKEYIRYVADPHQHCSRACWKASMATGAYSGENAPNWRGGGEHYYGPSWPGARQAARDRDKICQRCGTPPEDLTRELDVHHISAFRKFGIERHLEANDLSNLICYCRPCHLRMEPRKDD